MSSKVVVLFMSQSASFSPLSRSPCAPTTGQDKITLTSICLRFQTCYFLSALYILLGVVNPSLSPSTSSSSCFYGASSLLCTAFISIVRCSVFHRVQTFQSVSLYFPNSVYRLCLVLVVFKRFCPVFLLTAYPRMSK